MVTVQSDETKKAIIGFAMMAALKRATRTPLEVQRGCQWAPMFQAADAGTYGNSESKW
jgi:hypothetical protein